MRILFTLLLAVALVGCENPVEPTNTNDDQNQTNTIIINIGGDDDHSGTGKSDPGDDDVVQNIPPTLILPSTVTSEVGESVTVDLLASDADGDSVSIGYDPQTAPRDCSISPIGTNVARLSCVISSSSPADSPFTVRVQGDDGNGGVTVGFFIWVVNPEVEPV